MQGNWLVEVGELDAFRGVGATRVKDFLSQVVDAYRPAYARFFTRRPRHCVFVATTNEQVYLDDSTGGRRFWPVKAVKLDRQKLTDDRDQLWAEAVTMFKNGTQWHPTEAMLGVVMAEQEERNRLDPWEEKIGNWLMGKSEVTGLDVLTNCLGMETAHIEQRHFMRVAKIIKQLGWKSVRRREDNKRVVCFYNPSVYEGLP